MVDDNACRQRIVEELAVKLIGEFQVGGIDPFVHPSGIES